MESMWVLRRLPALLMDAAWGWKGGAAASLRGGIPPAAAPPPPFHKEGDGLWQACLLREGERAGFCGHRAATRILAFFLLDSAAGFMYNKASGNCDRQVREDGP